MKELQQRRYLCFVLNNSSELLKDPQLLDRNYVQWLERDFVGTIPHPKRLTGPAKTPFRSPNQRPPWDSTTKRSWESF